MVFKMNVVVVVVVMMSMLAKESFPLPLSSSEAKPGYGARARHWDQWHQLHHLHREQQQEQEQQRQLKIEHMRHHQTWRIWDAREQQLLREQKLELEQDLREEMEDIIKDNKLEHFAMQLSIDALGSILRPLREIPTHHHGEDCVTRTAPVTFMRLGLGGHFAYIVCSSGDGASMHIHFQELGGTTPSLDTTTRPPAITTPAVDTTTPAQPLCPITPTTTPGDTTTTPSF